MLAVEPAKPPHTIRERVGLYACTAVESASSLLLNRFVRIDDHHLYRLAIWVDGLLPDLWG